MNNHLVNHKKQFLFSIIGGIYLSLVFHISVQFPPLDSSLPLATSNAIPKNFIAVFFNYIRIALDSGYGIVQSFTAVFITYMLYHLWERISNCSYAHSVSLKVLSIIFGCINVSGLCMYWLDCLPMFSSVYWLIGCLLLALGWAFVFFLCSCLFFELLDNRKYYIQATPDCRKNTWIQEHFFLFCFSAILFAWLPWIISYYPASMDNDVFGQLYAWFYNPSNHHPWFSSCVLANCYRLGALLGNNNFGIFIYVILRDIILALIYAKCVCMLQESGFCKIIYYGTLIFYAFTPVWGAYAKHAFKDTFCAGLFCLYIITLVIMLRQLQKGILTSQLCLFHGIAALLASLFRHNCIYAILPTTLILLFTLISQKQPLRFVCIISLCIAAYFGYNFYILHFAGVAPGPVTESLAIPLQQTARLVRDYGDVLESEIVQDISGAFEYEKLAEEYNPILSDPIKWNCQVPTEQKEPGANGKWVKAWVQMSIRYPITYLEAAIGQSYGYYSFTPNLPEKSGNWNSGMTIFDWISSREGYNDIFHFHYIDTFNDLRQILHAWAKVWNKIPILSLTDTCAFYTWGTVLLFYYLWIKKKFLYLIPFAAIGIMILTCIASPVNDCFRYFAPAAASFPVLFILING